MKRRQTLLPLALKNYSVLQRSWQPESTPTGPATDPAMKESASVDKKEPTEEYGTSSDLHHEPGGQLQPGSAMDQVLQELAQKPAGKETCPLPVATPGESLYQCS